MTIKQIESRAGHTGLVIGEFVFAVGLLFASLLASIVILGHLNPLESPVLTGVFGAVLLIGLGHHRWYRRHREEIDSSHEHHEARERRGF
jgi:hypothetical protein